MIRIFFLVLMFQWSISSNGQKDTIILENYTKTLMTTKNSGEVIPISNLGDFSEAGFFLIRQESGLIKICNDQEMTVWVDGRLALCFMGCKLLNSSHLFKYSKADTVYVSFSSTSLVGLRCERITVSNRQMIKADNPIQRSVRDTFREFNIIAIGILIIIFAIILKESPARINYFLKRTYSLNTTSHQFVNTDFFDRSNFAMTIILSLCIAYQWIYFNQHTTQTGGELYEHLLEWVFTTIWILAFIFLKKLIIHITANLFKMSKIKDWQLFDMINFIGYAMLVLFLIILIDFIIGLSITNWIGTYWSICFVFIFVLSVIWVILKFMTLSSHPKLLIISYLCATELIPSIFLLRGFINSYI